MSTFEDRLSLALWTPIRPGDVATVRQQDLADALSLIDALRVVNAKQTEAIKALSARLMEAALKGRVA